MKYQPLANTSNLKDGDAVEALRCHVKFVNERKTGSKNGKRWSLQGVKANDASGDGKLTFWNFPEEDVESLKGEEVIIIAQNGKGITFKNDGKFQQFDINDHAIVKVAGADSGESSSAHQETGAGALAGAAQGSIQSPSYEVDEARAKRELVREVNVQILACQGAKEVLKHHPDLRDPVLLSGLAGCIQKGLKDRKVNLMLPDNRIIEVGKPSPKPEPVKEPEPVEEDPDALPF